MDEMPEEECAKIVDKGKCDKKGDKCMKSCDMCEGGEEMTTAEGYTTTAGEGGIKYMFLKIVFANENNHSNLNFRLHG